MGLYDELLAPETSQQDAGRRMPGIVTGIVKEIWDEKHKGQVKVEYNMGEKGKSLSDWMPVMTPYGGNGYGAYFLPEIGSEVVVGFLMGDKSYPVVLGCLWNEKAPQPKDTPVKENTKKQLLTKGGIELLLTEEKGKEQLQIQVKEKLYLTMDAEKELITLGDKDKKNMLELDTKKGKITMKAEKAIEINANGKAVLKLDGSSGSVEVKGNKITGNAQQSLQLKGNTTKVEGMTTEVSANGQMTVKSGGTTKVSGVILQLN